ncbi:MAG: hypothetical protein V3V05_01125 [Pontiella sp.]
MEKYNSARKTNITLLGISMIALISLGFFELTRGRRVAARRGYSGTAYKPDANEDMTEGLDSTNIYAAPKIDEGWQDRRMRGSGSRKNQQLDMTNVWMSMLRICCAIMPILYLGLLLICVLKIDPQSPSAWFIPMITSFVILFSLITAFGLFAKKIWGLTLGYILAIFNLLIFPIGTTLGMFLLMGLVGATPLFEVSSSDRKRKRKEKAKKKAAKKRVSAAVI